MDSRVIVYAGPSLVGTGISIAEQNGLTWRPPARRGDIASLVADEVGEPGVIGLADGTFHAYPSVGHAELRLAMEEGWRVYGLCSMGAIRAAEMKHMGMAPWGSVAARFCDEPDFADDEVAVLHSADAPFLSLSEPLIHIREFLSHMVVVGVLSKSEADTVLERMKTRWYGERTLLELRRQLENLVSVAMHEQLVSALSAFSRYRLKQLDLISFVNERPWSSG